MPQFVRPIVISATAVTLAILSIEAVRDRGGSWFDHPVSVEAHTWPGQNNTTDAVVLCNRVRGLLPRDATVTLLRPSQRPAYDATIYLAGVGCLPRQQVVAPIFDRPEQPRYVIALREPFEQPPYKRVASFPEGWLYERSHE
jgi:hypothetical protein